MEALFFPSDPPDILALKEKVNQFQNAATNSQGGCGCNVKKRREMAMQMFKQTAIEMSRNEIVKNRIGALLNGAETVLFFSGQDHGSAKVGEQTPFSKIETKATAAGAPPHGLSPHGAGTSTLGRMPPSNEPPNTPSK